MLLHDLTSVNKTQIKDVLQGLRALEKTYLKEQEKAE